nr:hypothetical protein [Wolbachia endosymbiont of Litomosoides brasiliensis]
MIKFCHKVKNLRPDIIYSADIITEFPMETDEIFQGTVNLHQRGKYSLSTRFSIFKAKKDTCCTNAIGVPKDVRKRRVKNLRK